MDPLVLLREAIEKNQLPIQEGNEFIFPHKDNVKFEKATPTSYKMHNGGFYTLGDLIFFYKQRDLGVSEYLRLAGQEKYSSVKFHDRKTLKSFLEGSGSTDGIIPTKATADEPAAKRTKLQSQGGLSSIADHVKNREIQCSDRNQTLISPRSFQLIFSLEKSAKLQNTKKNAAKRAEPTKYSGGMPIIVVPASTTSALTLYNIKSFLQDASFISHADAKKVTPERPTEVIITRKTANGEMKYKVVDSTRKFEKRHWDRVVAVFAQGQDWQFKGWKWTKPADVFDHAMGVYVYIDDIKLPPEVRSWNVSVCPLKRQQRHMDGISVYQIWEKLDKFIKTRKPHLSR